MQSKRALLSISATLLFVALATPTTHAQYGGPPPPSPYGPKATGADALFIRQAADALGMIRGPIPVQLVDALNRLQFSGTGTLYEGKAIVPIKRTVSLSLHLHASRVDTEEQMPSGPSVRTIAVVAGDQAWNEKQPGIDQTLTPQEVQQRRLAIDLLPQGFMRAVLLNDPKNNHVSQHNGIWSIATTADGVTIQATLDMDKRPVRIETTFKGKHWVMDYSDYKDADEYGVMFPTHIVADLGGRKQWELTVTDFRTAPYVVFPAPQGAVASASH